MIKNIDLIIEDESQGWDIQAEQGGLVHIPGATQKEPTNLLVKGYSISKLPLKLQKQLKDNGYKIATVDMYSFPEEAFVSKRDQLIALPEMKEEKGVHIIGWEGLEEISKITLATASVLLFRVDTSLPKFFIVCESCGEYYCLMGRAIVLDSKVIDNQFLEKLSSECKNSFPTCKCGEQVEKKETSDIQFYFSIKEYPDLKPSTPNCDRYHVIITPVKQWHREGCCADHYEEDEAIVFQKLEKKLKDKHGIELSEDTESTFSAYPPPGVDATTMRAALLDVGFQTCDAFDRFIAEHD